MRRKYNIQFKLFFLLLIIAQQLEAATLFVTNTNDAGAGSFRAVLATANNGDVIQFNIPGPGPHTIKPLSSYSIGKQLTIDGLAAGKPNIEFDGTLCAAQTGFDLNSVGGSFTVFQGLVLNGFTYNTNSSPILISLAHDVTVKRCYIGTDVTGTIAKPNVNGVWIMGSSNNIIGGASASDGNILSGNLTRGVWVTTAPATNNTVENNKVGISVNGTALPNFTGVEYQLGVHNNLIQHNNISYNTGDGLSFNQNSTGNKVYGNIFSYNGEHGVDLLNSDVQNVVVGVDFNGVGEANQIFNNGQAGVFISEWYSGVAYVGGAPSKITVRKNAIYCNGVKGITQSEKTGLLTSVIGNNGKSKPVVDRTSTETKTFGTGTPGDIIDIYVPDACNLCFSGNSQGQTWLASVVVAGDGTWTYSKVGGAACNSLIVTATNALGNTSEFASLCTQPIVDIKDTATCSTITLNLDVTQACATSYLWSTGAVTPTLTLSNVTPGLYWVEVKGIQNIADRDTFEIKQKSIPTVNLGADLKRCTNPFSPVVILNPALPNAFVYLWSTAEATPTISVNAFGEYFVKVTDNVSTCSNSDTIKITQEVLPSAALSDAEFCEDDSLLLTPGVFNSYRWSDNSTSSSLKVKTPGVYWVVVKNAVGCADSVAATISMNLKPVGVINDVYSCRGEAVLVNAGSWLSYLWDDASVNSTNTISTLGIHSVVVENNKNCKSTFSFSLLGNPISKVDLGADLTRCSDPFIPAVVLNPSLSAGYNYLWSTGDNSSSLSVNTIGQYFVKVADPVSGCDQSDTMNIILNAINVGSLPNTTICNGDSALLYPGTYPSYKWSNGSIDSSIVAKTAGVYWVVVQNLAGCTDSLTTTLIVNDLPSGAISDTSVCAGGSITVDAGAWKSYLWDNAAAAKTTSISSIGKHWVLVENNNSCKDTLFVQVNAGSNLNVSLNDPSPACSGDPVVLKATVTGVHTVPLSYAWDGVAGIDSILLVSFGKKKVMVIDARNCKGIDSVTVEPVAKPKVNLGKDTALCFMELGHTFKIAVPDTFASVTWMDNSSLSSIEITNAQTVIVKVSKGGCTASDTLVLSDHCTPLVWDFPNWVSPNGDGKNDHFYPKYVNDSTLGKLKETYFVVYDRWGLLMYERGKVVEIPEWDATYLGQTVAPGVYYWIVRWTDTADKKGEATGWMEVMY
ncbi:MAG: gliding motility-associated C-terminal domain-containing protein [Bacteroidetes bacterium]|nr:gliding motility-associated C-terminal domain-containing protein [Bacteroidota bacterium]